MVLHNQFELTLMALGSLRANYAGEIELILVDSGSSDETRYIERYVPGATYLRFDDNIGYLRGCNAGLTFATADTVLYLNNDIELAPGAVGEALRRRIMRTRTCACESLERVFAWSTILVWWCTTWSTVAPAAIATQRRRSGGLANCSPESTRTLLGGVRAVASAPKCSFGWPTGGESASWSWRTRSRCA
jgi:glycosyltransferase involved in cell wall biosynthesis